MSEDQSQVDSSRDRSRLRRAGVALGVTAVVVAMIAVPMTLRGAGSGSAPVVSAPSSAARSHGAASEVTPSAASAYPALLEDGQTVEASGRVVSVPGKPVRFCAPESFAAIGYAPGHEPAPAWCPLGVDVTGVDMAALSMRRTKDGASEGWGYLRGVYRSGTVAVRAQSVQRAMPDTYETLTTPPCPTPSAGWQRTAPGANQIAITDKMWAYNSAHPGQVVTSAIFRPSATSAVVVIAVADVAAARAPLPDAPRSLCLVRSRFTRTQVTDAMAPFTQDLQSHLKDGVGVVVSPGEGVAKDGQVEIDVEVVQMTPATLAWARAAPAGLVHLTPWLQQVDPGAPPPALLPTGPPESTPSGFPTDLPSDVPSA
jgi:hypothetical protein